MVFQLFLGGRLSKEIALVLNEISNTCECKKGTLSYKSVCRDRIESIPKFCAFRHRVKERFVLK